MRLMKVLFLYFSKLCKEDLSKQPNGRLSAANPKASAKAAPEIKISS